MNVLFLTLLDFKSLEERNIYTDLLRKFYKEGHSVYVISPVERKKNLKTRFIQDEERINILKLQIGNVQKTNIIEKGISTITLEGKFIAAIKKYFSNVKFDLVLYSTPPITLQKAVTFVKRRDNAVTYLMLKDIFPQNAVDMGMLSTGGVKGILYRYFRAKEKKLYRDSDYIGCMSEANVDYIKAHNPELDPNKVELCPNCIEVPEEDVVYDERILDDIVEKYGIPLEKTVFVYGGNLGKPQGVEFIIKCIEAIEKMEDVFFLIVGSGTEYSKIETVIKEKDIVNTKLYKYIPKNEYDLLLQACDVGVIFLDYRFTIPNFPSRLLGYLEAALPVFAVVDRTTDVGKVIREGNFGWTCDSDDVQQVVQYCKEIRDCKERNVLGNNARAYLRKYYNVNIAYNAIMKYF